MTCRRIAVVYFSGTEATHRLAGAVRRGARTVDGTDVVLHRIVGREIVEGRFRNEAVLEEIDAADGVIFGSPTYMGGPAAEFKAFADATSDRWTTLPWEGKVAAGFTVGANPAGDQLATLVCFGVLAAQHGMLWVGLDVAGGFDAAGRNRLGTQLGASAHALSSEPEASDLATATRLGTRVAEICARLDAGTPDRAPGPAPSANRSGMTSTGTILPERLETPRLILRRPIVDDAAPIFERYATDPEVVRYLSWAPHANVEETRAFIAAERARWEPGGDADDPGRAWTILSRSADGAIGMIDLQLDGFRAAIGYVLASPYRGGGLMSEALVAVRDAALSLPAVRRVQLVCDVDNPASARVMEKAGFEREGVLRRYMVHPNVSDAPRDCFCYSLVR